jgi:hypothetical protein
MRSLFPPPDPALEIKAVTIRLPVGLWDALDKIGELEKPPRKRNEVVQRILELYVKEWREGRKGK